MSRAAETAEAKAKAESPQRSGTGRTCSTVLDGGAGDELEHRSHLCHASNGYPEGFRIRRQGQWYEENSMNT